MNDNVNHPSAKVVKWADRKVAPKPCRICNEVFQPRTGGNLYCEPCGVEHKRTRHAETQAAWREKDPERHMVSKANFDLKKYGLTLDDYNRMFAEQGGACAVCKTKEPKGRGVTRRFAVDHCHTTGKVRGLLCHHCNAALGMVNDNIEILEKLIDYLKGSRDG